VLPVRAFSSHLDSPRKAGRKQVPKERTENNANLLLVVTKRYTTHQKGEVGCARNLHFYRCCRSVHLRKNTQEAEGKQNC